MILRGNTVTLRPLKNSDLKKVYSWYKGERFLANVWASYSSMVKVFERRHNNKYCQDFIVEDETHDSAGYVFLGRINWQHKNADAHIVMEQRHREARYTFDAAITFLDYSFNTLELHRIWGFINAANTRLIKLCERAGFKQEGTMREAWLLDGTYYDLAQISLLDSEFNKRMRPKINHQK